MKDKVLPSDNVLLGSCEESKKLLKMLSVEYISYHACMNDCILYRGEYADQEICLKCGHDRYCNSKKWVNHIVMKPAHKKIEKRDQRLRIQPLRGGNLLYITQMSNSWMIQMTKPPFYI